ncbi:GGDEF domain-containing protein [Thalassotalea fusca]
MLHKLNGIKTTLWTSLLVSLTMFFVTYSQTFLLTKQPLIEQVLYGLIGVALILTAQFGRSRFTFLTLVLFAYIVVVQHELIPSVTLSSNKNWFFLSFIFFLVYLSMVKDRGLMSVHLIMRVIGIVSCVALAKLWLMGHVIAIDYLKHHEFAAAFWSNSQIELPLFISVIILFWHSIRDPNLLKAGLLTTSIIWLLTYYQQIDLPLSFIITLLIVHFIAVIIIDSYYLAYRDELTKLPSRRALNQMALSLGRRYTVAMMDIDHFKKFNDTYGHDIGDQVLKLVGAKLAQVKGGGRVFRYGGEEFTVIFPRRTAEEAAFELERIRQAIADYKIVIRHPVRKTKKARASQSNAPNKTVSVTISIGVAMRQNKNTFEQTIKQADEALYRAKKNGRNNVSY